MISSKVTIIKTISTVDSMVQFNLTILILHSKFSLIVTDTVSGTFPSFPKYFLLTS